MCSPGVEPLGPLDDSFSFSFLETFGFSFVYPRSLPYNPEISPSCVSESIFQSIYSARLTRSLSTRLLPLVAATFFSACLRWCTTGSLTGWSFGRWWGVHSSLKASWDWHRAVHCLLLPRPPMQVPCHPLCHLCPIHRTPCLCKIHILRTLWTYILYKLYFRHHHNLNMHLLNTVLVCGSR